MTQTESVTEHRRAFAVCLGAGFMALLDVSIVNVALPSIENSLEAAASSLQWVVAGYALAFGLVLIPAGRLGDSFGRRRFFLIGLTVFVLASTACGLVSSAPALAGMRLVQGMGAGILNPQIIGFIQQLFSGAGRARAFGWFGAMVGVATASGPLLGGLLLALFGQDEGWRSVFLVNLPIGLVLIPLAWRLLPDHIGGVKRGGHDVVGLLLLGVAVLALMLPFITASENEEGLAAAPWWLLLLAAVMIVAVVCWERFFEKRGGNVVMPRDLIRTASFTFGAGIGLIYFTGFTSIFLIVTLYLQDGLGLTPLQAGLVQTPFALAGGVSAMLGGRLVVRIGRWTVVVGVVTMLLGLLAISLVVGLSPQDLTPWLVAGAVMISGFGNGLVISPNQTLALAQVPLTHAGTAGATLQTLQRIGTSTGLAITTGVFFATVASTTQDAEGYGTALRTALLVTMCVMAITLLIALIDALRRRQLGGTPIGTPQPDLKQK